jgi:V/A-type H+-transporting ATPase subunit I
MSLRPEPARWFECLIARDDLAPTLETLAAGGHIQLETDTPAEDTETLTDLSTLLEEFHQLESRYHPYWPQAVAPSSVAGKPASTLRRALQVLRDWSAQADPIIGDLERLQAEDTDLQRLREWLGAVQRQNAAIDIGALANSGPLLTTLLYRVTAETELPALPDTWFRWDLPQAEGYHTLLIGPADERAAIEHELSAQRVRRIPLPGRLHGTPRAAGGQIDARLQVHAKRREELHRALRESHERFALTEMLGEIARLDWFLRHVRYQTSGANLAWVRGWSNAPDAATLQARLAAAGVRALVQFSPAPPGRTPPLVLRNPRWARPFELFPRLLGMPSAAEADPSRILALVVPLLFGYMFGDLGQGLVLVLAGLWLRRRYPDATILIPAGASAMVFGLLFGSVFAREDLLPPLWLHPMSDALLVLSIPLYFGALLLLLGMLLNGFEASWRGELRHWWGHDAPVIVLYLSLISLFIHFGAIYGLLIGLLGALVGALFVGHGNPAARIGLAAGELFEQIFQLAVNTLSFARVGAFALAHAGLSQAVVGLADIAGDAGWLVLAFGNLFILALEGLVVFIQTTRLVLFEFFIRFLRGEGQGFTPLPAPDYFAFTATRSQP